MVAPPVHHSAVLREGGAFFVKTKSCAGFSIRAGPPIAMAAAAPRWKETAMLVIDMQNDFILPASPMHVAGAEAIVPSVIRAVSAARERGVFVVWVVREHDPWGRDVEVFRRHFYADGKGPTSKGSKGAELVDGLVIEEGDYKLIKTRFSAFFATHLHSLLQTAGIKELVVVGVRTPNCIRQTVFDAVALDYQQVTVITDATAAAYPEVHIVSCHMTLMRPAATEEVWALCIVVGLVHGDGVAVSNFRNAYYKTSLAVKLMWIARK
ncbi:hypothetical protein Taro_013660 [Colocasia esculenta]|uniref:Isochorismatase-like domain-containing protein n=1 Tax=Colocasia esculenta TaxID=4460 RepID=A0A843UCB1_COLES|nr:hypothetical protein [Colocasia esculenta]